MKQLKLVFILENGKLRIATEEELVCFFSNHFQYSKMSLGDNIKTSKINATFDHYDRHTNTVYLNDNERN